MYDPQAQLPPPYVPPPERRTSPLVWVAVGLGGFIVIAGTALALLIALSPGLRARLPFFGPAIAAPPERPNRNTPESATGAVQISEDFNAPTVRWDQSLAEIRDGGYLLRLDTPNNDGYGLFLGPAEGNEGAEVFDASQIANFDLAVDVEQLAGDPTSEYGIRFRQSGPGDYLMFSISGSGYYRLLRVTDEEYRSLVPWTYDRRVKTGAGAVNRLRVMAEGDSVKGYLNGEELLSYNDEGSRAGQLTLGVASFEQGGLQVRFSNLAGNAEAGAAGTLDVNTSSTDLDEDFSDPEQARWSTGGATIVDGGYEIATGAGVQSWQQPLPTGSSRVSGDFVLEVEASLISGGEGAAYGIMFGDGGAFDFYSLLIFPEGGIGLFLQDPTQGSVAIIPPFLFDQINPGEGAVNKLRVEVNGRTLNLTINDQQLPELELPEDLTIEGMAGMIVLSGAEGMKARFDNFRLEALTR